MAKRIEHASRFLRGSDGAAALLAEIERNRALLLAIRERLPHPLGEHCLHVGIDEKVLTLVTDSPVWSSRLRFFSDQLIQSLNAGHGPIASCRIRVQPSAEGGGTRSLEGRARRMSDKTVTLLREAADGLGETSLARALRRLAEAGATGGRSDRR